MEFSGLMFANIEWKTASGEVVFRMKRKEEWGPTYYVFEKNLDVLSEEERAKFEEGGEAISGAAGLIGISLFDSREIMEAVEPQIKKVIQSEDAKRAMAEADKTGEFVLVRDIDISLYDHGTKKITSLTIGISVPAGASEIFE